MLRRMVELKFKVFWDVMLCCWVCSSQCFEGSYGLQFFVPLHQEDEGLYDALKHQTLLTQHNSVMSHGTWIMSNTTTRIFQLVKTGFVYYHDHTSDPFSVLQSNWRISMKPGMNNLSQVTTLLMCFLIF